MENLSDPFFDTERCVDRLCQEYLKNPRLIVAVDFDDTVSPWRVPPTTTFTKVWELLNECKKLDFYITIYTASHESRHIEMVDYFAKYGIKVDSINVNPIELPYGKHGKIYYNIFLDDKGGLGQAYEILFKTVERIKSNKKTLANPPTT